MTIRKLKLAPAPQRISKDLVRRAVALYRSDTAPRSVRRHNARAWLRSITLLGDGWILNKKRPDAKWGHGKAAQ